MIKQIVLGVRLMSLINSKVLKGSMVELDNIFIDTIFQYLISVGYDFDDIWIEDGYYTSKLFLLI